MSLIHTTMNTIYPGQATKKVMITVPNSFWEDVKKTIPRQKRSQTLFKAMQEYMVKQKNLDLWRRMNDFVQRTKNTKMSKKDSVQILREIRYGHASSL